jgi:carboxypeptidase A1
VRDLALRNRIALHIDFHTYGQLVLYPWGYTSTPAPDRDRFAAIGDRMTSAIVAAHGTRYKLSSAVEFYPASGDMPDWTYGEAGALAYTIELRPQWPGGRGGFVQPPAQIAPTCDEGLAGVLALRSAGP